MGKDVFTRTAGLVIGRSETMGGVFYTLLRLNPDKDGNIRKPLMFEAVRIKPLRKRPPVEIGVQLLPSIELGSLVGHDLTGFSGVVTRREAILDGIPEYFVEPPGADANGDPREGTWLPENRLVILDPEKPTDTPKDEKRKGKKGGRKKKS
jgi:hypothetical protein